MATSEPTVEERLFAEAPCFDFFQAVRLLERLSPARAPVGLGGPPAKEVVRFRAIASMSYPPSAIYDLKRPPGPLPVPVMTVAFLGLTGPSGVLPRHYTELIMRQNREARGSEKYALRDWLDQFNHRFVSLFFRAWKKYRFWAQYEDNAEAWVEPDLFTRSLLSLIGLGTPGLKDRLQVTTLDPGSEAPRVVGRVDDLALLRYSGLLAQRIRTAVGLQAFLTDYYGQPVKVVQFRGQWLELEPASRSRLGLPEGNAELGLNAVAGERVWDVQGKVRLRLGPLGYARFVELLPDRAPAPQAGRVAGAFFLLLHLVRLYVGPELDFDVQLVLRAEEVPECCLDEGQEGDAGPRLGWNTWICSQQPALPVEDAVFEGDDIVRLDGG